MAHQAIPDTEGYTALHGDLVMSESSNSSSGVGFFGVLFIVFLVLKLTGNIVWSWWWVTSPLWGSFAVFLLLLGIVLIVGDDRYKGPS